MPYSLVKSLIHASALVIQCEPFQDACVQHPVQFPKQAAIMATFTPQNREEFFLHGFTRVSGGIPAAAVTRMKECIWRTIDQVHGIQRHDRSTWTSGVVLGIGHANREPEFQPFGTPEIETAISDLLERDDWRRPRGWGQILATLPAGDWNWSSLFDGKAPVHQISWHTDYEYDLPSSPLPGVQIFGLLEDLQIGGGGTLVMAHSHRLIQQFVTTQPPDVLAKMKRARVALLNSHPWLQQVCETPKAGCAETWIANQHHVVDGVPLRVAELTGQAGDVYFTHPWLLHATSPNGNDLPRLMCTQRVYASC